MQLKNIKRDNNDTTTQSDRLPIDVYRCHYRIRKPAWSVTFLPENQQAARSEVDKKGCDWNHRLLPDAEGIEAGEKAISKTNENIREMSKQRFVITSEKFFMIYDIKVTDKELLSTSRGSYIGKLSEHVALCQNLDNHLKRVAITRFNDGMDLDPYTGEFEGLTISSGVSKMEAEVEV